MRLDDDSPDPFHDWLDAKPTAEIVRALAAQGVRLSAMTVRNWRNGVHVPHRTFHDAIKAVALTDGWTLSTDHLLAPRRS